MSKETEEHSESDGLEDSNKKGGGGSRGQRLGITSYTVILTSCKLSKSLFVPVIIMIIAFLGMIF